MDDETLTGEEVTTTEDPAADPAPVEDPVADPGTEVLDPVASDGAGDTSALIDEILGGEFVEDTYEIVAEEVDPRLFMSTSFEEYTVVEGLLLLILLLGVIGFCVKILKGGFYWL